MKFIRKIQKSVVAGVRSFGSNKGGCGDSHGDGPNPKGSKANYQNNQK